MLGHGSAPDSVPSNSALRAPLVAAASCAAALLALGLAVVAQVDLSQRVSALDGLILYAVAVFLFVKVLASVPMLRSVIARPLAPPLTFEWRLSGYVALALGALTFLTAGGNTVRPLTVVYWLGAIAATFHAAGVWPDLRSWWAAVKRWRSAPPAALSFRVPWLALVVLGIVLLAAFYRYYRLDVLPPEMTSDHAEKLYDVQDLVDGLRPWFFPRNTGREPMQFYLTLPVATLRGVDYLDLKLMTAFISTLGVLWCFLFARQFFGSAVALLAAFLMAVAQWDVEIARVGLRFPFGASFSALCLYLLFRVLRYGRRRDFLVLGLGLGIGLYGYTPFRTVVLFVALAFALTLILRWRDGLAARLDLIRNGALCYLMTAVVFLPLARYMVDVPSSFWERSASRLVTDSTPGSSPALVFLSNLKNAALMFNWQGDVVWVNHIPNAPFLDPLTGALFLLGVVYAVVRLVRDREWLYAYLLLALPVLTLSSTAAIAFPGENPSVVRAGPAIPVVFLLAALPLALTARYLRTRLPTPTGTILATGLVGVALGVAATVNYGNYFVTYAEQYPRAAINSSEMGQVVRGFATSTGDYSTAYHIAWPHWADTRTIGIAAGQPRWNNALLSPDAVQRAAAGPTPQLYLLHPDDQASLALLRTLRPEGHATVYQSHTPGKDFVVYLVPAPPG